jgi:GT2 family glycosyltransferase
MLSVVTVTYNSEAVIRGFLQGVSRLPVATHLIAVDNGSTDRTLKALRDAGSPKIISGHGNIGFGPAVNLGVRAASTDTVLILNPDAAPIEADDALLRRFLVSTAPAGVTGCAIKAARGRAPGYAVRPETGWREEVASFLARSFLKPRQLHLPRRPALAWNAKWASGAAILVRRSEFLRVGGFDERYFMYYEDRDLCRRYASHGYPIRRSRAICVLHEVGQSSPVDNGRRLAWGLLGLVQYTAIHQGLEEAAKASNAIQRALAAIEHRYVSLGEWAALELPLRKAREARHARESLRGDAVAGVASSRRPFYPDAIRLFAAA